MANTSSNANQLNNNNFNGINAQIGESVGTNGFTPNRTVNTSNQVNTSSDQHANNTNHFNSNSNQFFNNFKNTSNNLENPGEANTGDNQGNVSDQSKLVSSIKDDTISLCNLRLHEIIDLQLNTLNKNITEWRKSVQTVLEYDMKLISKKNAYVKLQEKIRNEDKSMDELNELLDYCSEQIGPVDEGKASEIGKCCLLLENISNNFSKTIEACQDDRDEVLDLLTANYELINVIDDKLDSIEKDVSGNLFKDTY